LCCATVSQGATQYRCGFVIDEAVVAHTIATAEGLAVVGFAGVVGGDGEAGLVDGQAGVGVAEGVVVGAQAAGTQAVGAGIDRALSAAAVGQRSTQYCLGFVIDEAVVA